MFSKGCLWSTHLSGAHLPEHPRDLQMNHSFLSMAAEILFPFSEANLKDTASHKSFTCTQLCKPVTEVTSKANASLEQSWKSYQTPHWEFWPHTTLTLPARRWERHHHQYRENHNSINHPGAAERRDTRVLDASTESATTPKAVFSLSSIPYTKHNPTLIGLLFNSALFPK